MERWKPELQRRGDVGITVAPHHAEPLREAQAEIVRSFTPATTEEIEARLMALRSNTQVRNESLSEAETSFATIKAQLAKVPADILGRACDAYTRAPGTRFFPRSSGELFAFINPMIGERTLIANRLGKLAAVAEAAKAEADRLKGGDGLYTLDELRAIPQAMRATTVIQGWATQAMVDQLDAEAAA